MQNIQPTGSGFKYRGKDAGKGEPSKASQGMLYALQGGGKHIYAGTVDPVTMQERRARNKRARAARRKNRLSRKH